MIIGLEQLKNYEFSLSQIRAILQLAPFRQLEVRRRTLNGFVVLLHGKCRFSFENGSFDMEIGDVAYLPRGSRHIFDILTEDTEFYRIDFQTAVNGEAVFFSDRPLLMHGHLSPECMNGISQLTTDFDFAQNSVSKNELLCRIFRELTAASPTAGKSRLAPAVSYLLQHPEQEISGRKLAQLCLLSAAQFYALFKEEYGITPLAYRNRLLLQKACLLLREGALSVTEIAETLGFETLAYFSRFFKKHMGVVPSRYASWEETS